MSNMIPATVSNMKKYHHPNLVAIDCYGNQFSADPGDYWMLGEHESIGDNAYLMIKVTSFIDPRNR